MTPLPGSQPAKPVAKPSLNQSHKKQPQPGTLSPSPGVNKPPQVDQQQQHALKCPRCDSSNTKFCYYNNYSLAQPRYFCKACRRYWTKDGALRNVPIGGGSHKNKRLKSYASSSKDFPGEVGGLKLYHGGSAAIDFQLSGFEVPRDNPSNPLIGGICDSQFSALGEGNPSSILAGLSFPLPMVVRPQQQPLPPASSVGPPNLGGPGSMTINGNLASSIESLSCINQDLHWKLQQQRLASLYADSIPRDNQAASSKHESFSITGMGSHQENVVNGTTGPPPATEWFFGNSTSYASVTPSPTDSGNNDNENTSCNNWNRNSSSNNNNNNGNGGAVIHHHQGWGAGNVQQQYASLP
ncbi:hypothetical protein MLD38_005024 [Melastoma candidum]|uniref:Uncharacterized protein n=1 Tax=Melastoma candidum TaxID=119954 RepID=A0ACB9S7Z3_9MYRT|nr:hypothetical protein MLD38_005024 [Melastoma candidum]